MNQSTRFLQRFLAVLILTLTVGLGSGFAQLGSATLVGRVQDSTGSLVVAADVEVKRVSTNELFRMKTTGSGDYSVVNLPVGQYEVRVSTPGFKTEVRTGITLAVGSTLRVDFQLQIGAVQESVEVVSQAPILKTEKPEFGQVIDNEKIVALPLNTRDVLGTLGNLTPGLAPARAANTVGGSYLTGSGNGFNVRGQRAVDNIVLLDGAMVSQGNAVMTFVESPEAVQEFEVKTGLYDSQYGVKPGGQFIMVTKSGTNAPHGSAFEWLRNNYFDARNYFDRASRPAYKRHQFGGVFGAPIFIPKVFNGKDRAWFFFSYSGERIHQFTSLTGVVPTDAQKTGQFATTITDPLSRTPFPGNLIPANRINPIAQKLVGLFPAQNTTGQGFNFTSPNSSANSKNNQVVAKVDINLSPTNRWSGRFLWDDSPVTRTNPIQYFFRVDPISTWTQSVTNTRTFKSRIVNEFGASFYRRPYYAGLQSSSPGFGQTLGLPGFPASPTDVNGVPVINITGFLTLGDGSNRGPSITGNWEVRDNVSFNQGAHSLKFGYNWKRHIEFFAFAGRSSFTFQPRYSGNAFADFLLGYAQSTTPGAEGLRGRLNQNGHFMYFDDSWKLSSRLTADIGVRFEYRGPWLDQRGFNSNFLPLANTFSPPLQSLQLQPWETGRFQTNQTLFSFNNKQGWQPRVGLSYRLTNKTVIRTGFGIYGNEPPLGYVQGMSTAPRPNTAARTYISDPATPNLLLSNPFPSTIAAGSSTPTITSFENPLPMTQSYSWGLSIQQQVASRTVFDVGYQGSHTAHDYSIIDYNDATPGPGAIQARRPFPLYQSIRLIGAGVNSSYNGLEVRLEQRPGPAGLFALVSYSWSKTIDTMGGRLYSAADPTAISRNVTLKNNRGQGEGNPNRIAGTVGYQLPFGVGKPFLTNGVGAAIAGGWSFSTILTLSSGFYITPVVPSDIYNVGSTTTLRPDVLRDPNFPAGNRTPQKWFDTSAFVLPTNFRYGNAGRSIINGPGVINLDISVARTFKVTEKSKLQFHFDAFNSTNHTNFSLPGTSIGTATFGVVGSAFESRDLQFGLKFYF